MCPTCNMPRVTWALQRKPTYVNRAERKQLNFWSKRRRALLQRESKSVVFWARCVGRGIQRVIRGRTIRNLDVLVSQIDINEESFVQGLMDDGFGDSEARALLKKRASLVSLPDDTKRKVLKAFQTPNHRYHRECWGIE